MKYLKTFESFSPINEEEEGFFGDMGKKLSKFFLGDVVENHLKAIMYISKKDENEVRKVIEQIKSEKELSKREELLKSLIGDYDDSKVMEDLIRIFSIYKEDGVRLSQSALRYELDCMTPEEKEDYESIKGGNTGWEGSRGFH
jgi:mRNA-degrading endonuclease YafQ of YafQ-DinJ toxin-antitoxin module